MSQNQSAVKQGS